MSVVYREYIESDAWKLRRVAALERSERRPHKRRSYLRWPVCEVCGRSGTSHKNSRSSLDSRDRRFRVEGSNGLHVHHLHYRTLGSEEPDDLIVLCTDACHWGGYDLDTKAWRDKTMRRVGETDEEWRAKRDAAGPYPQRPKRVGCHERAHDDPEFASLIRRVARSRTY